MKRSGRIEKIAPNKKNQGKKRPGYPEDTSWHETFLTYLRETAPVIGTAAKAAGICRMTVTNHRQRHPEFAQEMDRAIQDGIDNLEDVLLARAKKSDTTAMIFMLKALRPEKYRERFEHSGPGGGPIHQFHDGPGARELLERKLLNLNAGRSQT